MNTGSEREYVRGGCGENIQVSDFGLRRIPSHHHQHQHQQPPDFLVFLSSWSITPLIVSKMARRGRGGGRGVGQGGRRRPQPLSIESQEARIQQMRALLHPQITTHGLLRQYLEAARWEVARAVARWTRNRERILAGYDSDSSISSLSSVSSSSSSDGEGRPGASLGQKIDLRVALEELPFNKNLEQERRDTALAFRLQVEENHELVLSRSEAVLLLHLSDWDIGAALATFESHEAARDRLRVVFDGMRKNTDDMNQQSARLATLIDITDRADWMSIKLFLQKVKWNLVEAVIEWYTTGIMPFKNSDAHGISRDRPHWALRVDENGRLRKKPTEAECQAAAEEDPEAWAADDDDFTNFSDDTSTNHCQNDIIGQPERKRAPGFIIHAGENRPLEPGPPNSSKFLIEYIQKGRYRWNIFANPKYFFPDRVDDATEDASDAQDNSPPASPPTLHTPTPNPDDSNSPKRPRTDDKTTFVCEKLNSPLLIHKRPKPEGKDKAVVQFDFETSKHLVDLNNWRRQNYARIRGDVLRARSQNWTAEELEFLYQLTQEWLDDLKVNNPFKTRKELLENAEVSTATKKSWERRMNALFTGTTPQGAHAPRWDRNAAAVMTQRGRWPRLYIHFRVNADKKWLAKLDPAEKARLEAERDVIEAADLLLTAVAMMANAEREHQEDNDAEEEDEEGGDQEEE